MIDGGLILRPGLLARRNELKDLASTITMMWTLHALASRIGGRSINRYQIDKRPGAELDMCALWL